MQKLTAGIFAGIFTIVSVNAASAAITSQAYVDDLVGGVKTSVTQNTTDIAKLNKTVDDNKAAAEESIGELKESVEKLAGDGTGSVADQIASALGEEFPEGSTVSAELDKKQDKSLSTVATAGSYIEAGNNVAANLGKLDTQVKSNADAISAINSETTGILATSKAYTDALANGAVKTNTDNISGLTSKIGEVAEGKTVVGMIEDAATAASTGLTDVLGDGFDKDSTVADALAEKANVNVTVAGNMITTDASGQITALNPTESEDGVYVLTAKLDNGKATYYWENIQRGTTTE